MDRQAQLGQLARVGFDRILDIPKPAGLAAMFALIGIIVILDATVYPRISIGVLYPLPVVFGSLFMNRFQIIALAIGLALLREQFHPSSWDPDAFTRLFYLTISHAGVGLFSGELARNRRLAIAHYEQIRREVALRQDAERQLRNLIESSPAAIVMLDADGRVDLANDAAHRLLALEQGSLPGRHFSDFLPIVADLLSQHGARQAYRTAAHCRGRRANGESFIACLWFSTFATQSGPRLAAIVTDSSDDIRDLQESSLQSLLRSTRVLVGSVSHEIRNICAAIGVVHANLRRVPGLESNEDYLALGTLSQGLARIATLELQSSGELELESVDIAELIEEFSVVEGPAFEAAAAVLTLNIEPDLPRALGDRHGLLQVLLNLTRNSLRALASQPGGSVLIEARRDGDAVAIVHHDSGPGILEPGLLFKPFQSGAGSTGLGLFVSRAIIRSFGGELAHEPSASGCRMVIRLRFAPDHHPPASLVDSGMQSFRIAS